VHDAAIDDVKPGVVPSGGGEFEVV
jgi:hypothetical protein